MSNDTKDFIEFWGVIGFVMILSGLGVWKIYELLTI